MTKADLVTDISDKTGVEKIAVQATIESFMQSVIDAMENGENVYLRGFGSFYVKEISEKFSARNPKTGKLIYVPKKSKVRFRVSKKFKEFINK